MLDEQGALPQQVNVAVFVVDFLDAFLERGDLAAFDAKDLKKLISETLGIGVFAFDVLPVFGKNTGAVGDFFPVKWHGGIRVALKPQRAQATSCPRRFRTMAQRRGHRRHAPPPSIR